MNRRGRSSFFPVPVRTAPVPPRRNRPERLEASPYLLEAVQVAYYHCVLEMPLKSIAELMGKSPATITRRLDEVRQAGWLRDRPEVVPPAEVWEQLQSP